MKISRRAKVALGVVGLSALGAAGAATAAVAAGAITLHGGESVKVNGTKISCIAKTKAVTRVITVTSTTTVTATPPAPTTFSGNGSVDLPPFTITQGETLSYTWDGGDGGVSFFVNDATQASVVLDSDALSGSTYLPAGTHELQVVTIGNWTITVHG